MTDKLENNQIEPQSDPLMDTQWLLGSGTPAEGSFALEDILAEFSPGGEAQTAETAEAAVPEEPAPEEAAPEEPAPVAAPPPEPPKNPPPPETPAPAAAEAAESPEEPPVITEEMLDEAFFADMLTGSDPSTLPPQEPEEGTEEGGTAEPPAQGPEPPEEAPSPPDARANAVRGVEPVSMESIENLMAHTVDAVKEEQEQRQERLRKRLEKARKAVTRSFAKKEAPLRKPVPDAENEPLPNERAMWNKRRCRESRKSLHLTALLTAVLWLPWVLAQFGIALPFFSESGDWSPTRRPPLSAGR